MLLGSPETLLFSEQRLEAHALASASRGGAWGVAFSGGADSLALLLTLWQHFPDRRKDLVALHFNHRLRGAESERDAHFCAQVCLYLGISFRQGSWENAPQQPSEATARDARSRFFEQALAELGSGTLWTGHHADDVVETQLMRLARGSGSQGLSAPRPVQSGPSGMRRLRPLLHLRRTEIEEALRRGGWSWCWDSSNGTDLYFRNRLRHQVVPAWVDASERDAVAGASRTRKLLEEDDAALSQWLDDLFPSFEPAAECLDLAPLSERPLALWRRLLHRWQPTQGLSADGFERLLLAARKGDGIVPLSVGLCEIRGTRLWVREPAGAVWSAGLLPRPGGLALPDGSWVGIEDIVYNPEDRERIFTGTSDPFREAWLSLENAELRVRFVEPGLKFQPMGMSEPAKLQDLMVNRKISRFLRSRLPLVVDARTNEILWVPGFPPAQSVRITKQSTVGVRLTYCPGTFTFTS